MVNLSRLVSITVSEKDRLLRQFLSSLLDSSSDSSCIVALLRQHCISIFNGHGETLGLRPGRQDDPSVYLEYLLGQLEWPFEFGNQIETLRA